MKLLSPLSGPHIWVQGENATGRSPYFRSPSLLSLASFCFCRPFLWRMRTHGPQEIIPKLPARESTKPVTRLRSREIQNGLADHPPHIPGLALQAKGF